MFSSRSLSQGCVVFLCFCSASLSQLTLFMVPVGGSNVTGDQQVAVEAFIRNDGPDDVPMAVQVDYPCSLTGQSGSTGTITDVVVFTNANGSASGVPWLCPLDGLHAANQTFCASAAAHGPGRPPCVLPSGATRYLSTIVYEVSTCATGAFDAQFEIFGNPPPPGSFSGTIVLLDDGPPDHLRLPFTPQGTTLVVESGSCCTGDSCIEDGINQSCCLTNHPNGAFYAGRSCDAPHSCEVLIPTVSQWGLVIFALLLLTAAKISFSNRPARAG
ncbi:MAG: hypothetical protein AABZ47_01730 [Planctomycetota bacterium]